MALTLAADPARLLCPASAAHNTLAAHTTGIWVRMSTRTTGKRHWSKSSTMRLASSGTTGDLRSVMDVVEVPPDIFNATSSGTPAAPGTTWYCIIVTQSVTDGVRIYVGTETVEPAEVSYADRTAGDPTTTPADDSSDQWRLGGTGTGSSGSQQGDYSYCFRANRVYSAQERENWWRTLALPTDGSVLGDWRPGENGLIDVPDHGPLGLNLTLSGTITDPGTDPTLPGAGGTPVSQAVPVASETLQSLAVSAAAASEALAGVDRAVLVPWESLAAVQRGQASEAEVLQGVRGTTAAPAESLGGLRAASPVAHETLQHLLRSTSAAAESLASARREVAIAHEVLRHITRGTGVPAEVLARAVASHLAEMETLLRVARAIAVPFEAGSTATTTPVSQAVAVPMESLQGLRVARLIAVEALQGIAAGETSAAEALAAVRAGVSVPIELLGQLVVQHLAAAEILRGIGASRTAPSEWLQRVAAATVVPVAWLGPDAVSRILRDLDRSGHRFLDLDFSAHRLRDVDRSAPRLIDIDHSGGQA